MTAPWGSWPPPSSSSGGSGGSGGDASGLATTGAPVDVSGAAPPVQGQVLTALDAEHAIWRVPGLHYDPGVRFNVNAGGTATIEPGTWGFVETVPTGFEGEAQIFVVSSLTSPPVDSRFGLYLGVTLDRTVEVHLVGASEIIGLDGVRGTSCVLYPGAMYEWVFYHEAGAAIWGLVSDTARMAQRFQAPWLAVSDPNNAVFPITKAASEPSNGSALIYRNVSAKPTAAWELPALAGDAQHGALSGGGLHALATASANGFLSSADFTKLAGLSQAWKAPVRVTSTSAITLSGLQTIDGVAVIAGDRVLVGGQVDQTTNGIYIVAAGAWARSSDNNTTALMPAGMLVPVTEGTVGQDTIVMLTSNAPITLGSSTLNFAAIAAQRGISAPSSIVALATGSAGTGSRWAPIDHTHSFPAPNPSLNNFRLSNVSTSSSPQDITASTLFLALHNGHRVALHDGSNWQNVTLASPPSIAIAGLTAGIPCDVFLVYISISNATLELSPWTNASTRANAITQLNGVWTKNGVTTRRYVGTILPDSATTFTHRSVASDTVSPVCGIWNQDNRILGAFNWTPTFDTWAIPSANTWQSLNGQASAKVQYVQGQSIDVVSAVHIGAVFGPQAGSVGVGIDSTSVPSGFRDIGSNANGTSVRAELRQLIAAGAHNLNAIANGAATSVSFYGAHATMLGGISADLWF